jgi:hypothetical protein
LPVYKEAYERQSKVPPNLAWEFGWNEIVQATASLYHGLPAEEQKRAGVVASSYGPAGAIDFLGGRYGLPKAVSPQLAYHDFGPRNYTGDVLVMVGYDRKALEYLCTSVEPGPEIKNPYGYDGQRGPIINVCRGLRFDLQRDWAGFQHY